MAATVGPLECLGGLAAVSVCSTGAALCLCSDEPVDDDPRAFFSRHWQTDLLNAPCASPDWFCCAVFCTPCAQYKLRTWALGENIAAYRCCQGYFDTPCCRSGNCGDEANPCCLVLEAWCCPCFAVQATRFYVMDTRNIAPSGTDNKLIRFNNFLQIAACLCQSFDCEGADLVSLAADVMWTTLMGCMTAQVATELRAEAKGTAQAPQPGMAPQPMMMSRYPSGRRVTPSAPPPAAHPMGGYQQGYQQGYGYGQQQQVVMPVATYGGYPGQGHQAALPVATPVAMAPQAVAMARPVQVGSKQTWVV